MDISEPVFALARSLKVIEDWEVNIYEDKLSHKVTFVFVHIKTGKEITLIYNSHKISLAWLTADEKEFLILALTELVERKNAVKRAKDRDDFRVFETEYPEQQS